MLGLVNILKMGRLRLFGLHYDSPVCLLDDFRVAANRGMRRLS